MNYYPLKIGYMIRNKLLIKVTKIHSIIYFLKIKTT